MLLMFLGSLSWNFVGPEGGDILSVASDDAGHVLAAGLRVAYYSSDSGYSWSRVSTDGYEPLPGFLRGYKVEIMGGRMYVFHSQGFLVSADGSIWNNYSLPDIDFVSDELGGSIAIVSRDTLYVLNTVSLTPTPVFQTGVDTSLIAAASFDTLWYAFARTPEDTILIYRGILDTAQLRGEFYYSGDIIDVAINPFNPDEVLLSLFGGIYSSTDGGASFSQDFGSLLSGLFVPTDIDFVAADTIVAGSFFFSGGYIGVRGFLGWSFSQVYPDAVVRDVDGSYLSAFGRGVVYTPDGGSTFEERNNGLYAQTLLTPGMVSNTRTDRLSFINFGGVPFYTDDGGSTWSEYGYKMDVGYSIEASPYDQEVVYIGGYKNNGNATNPRAIVLARSSDGGATFTAVRDTTPDAYYAMPMELQVGSDPARLFLVYYGWRMEFSSDSGNTVSQVMTSDEYSGFCFSCIDTLFMVVNGGSLYTSYDAGETWDSLTTLDISGDVYLTYRDGILYYTTGGDAYVRAYNLGTGILDSIDLSGIFSRVEQVEFSLNGHVFLLGYQGSSHLIAYGSSFDNLTVDNAPADNGAMLPLSSHVFFYSPEDGGFYVSTYPLAERELSGTSTVVYLRNGIRVPSSKTIAIYSLKGALVKKIRGDFIPYGILPAGVYMAKTDRGTFRIIMR